MLAYNEKHIVLDGSEKWEELPIWQWEELPVFLREPHLRIDRSAQWLSISAIIFSDVEVTKPL